MTPAHPNAAGDDASLIVTDPSGNKNTVRIEAVPFRIGRQPDNNLVLRDSRASRLHARISFEEGAYFVEDAQSRHGVYVNGEKISRKRLRPSDRIEFGFPDSYVLQFALGSNEMERLLEKLPSLDGRDPQTNAPPSNLAKLRAVMEVARSLQTALTTEDILASVVDASLAITGAERGFLLLRGAQGLDTRIARDRAGHRLSDTDLRVPRSLIQRALTERRELLSMSFDPLGAEGVQPEHSVAALDLRAVVCVPLVRIRISSGNDTSVISSANDTVGVLYMDSRAGSADLSAGNRELLQTLALEASTVLENARLLEEERLKQKIEEELGVARGIQQSLLPKKLPVTGWFRAAGSSVASHEVGGDYFDLVPIGDSAWAIIVADVSGKGVSSALLASLLQGALYFASDERADISVTMSRVNRFLGARTGGEKYATIFYGILDRDGSFEYINAGHCVPILAGPAGPPQMLQTTGMPVGLFDEAEYPSERIRLTRGQRLVLYSDGVSEARNERGDFFGTKRLAATVSENATAPHGELHDSIQDAVRKFTGGREQDDDLTLLVIEYAG